MRTAASHRALDAVEYGDAGLLLRPAGAEDPWEWARALAETARERPPAGLVDVVAGFETVYLAFDPVVTDHAAVLAWVEGALTDRRPPEPRRFEIPVVYGGPDGPDLDEVAAALGLTAAEVIALHTGADWTVRVIGSPLGAPLLDGPSPPVGVPRLDSPRTRVAPGSVGLSGRQSIVYNGASPGGWRLIGRTPSRLFDIHAPTAPAAYVPYRPGDRLRFRAIPAEDWDRYAGTPPVELPEEPVS